MKSNLKKILIPVISSIILAGTAIAQTKKNVIVNTNSKNDGKNESVRIKIVKSENGKTTVIDTVLTNPSDADLAKFEIDMKNIPAVPEIPAVPGAGEVPAVPNVPGTPKARVMKKIIIEDDGNGPDTVIINEEGITGDVDKELKDMGIEIKDGKGKCVIVMKDISATSDGTHEAKTVKVVVKKVELKDPNEGDRKTLGKNISTDNNLKVEQLNFYPNPNNGKFNLTFTLKEKGSTTINVFDSEGKKVYTENLRDFSGDYNKAIDLSGSPKGIYFLNVTQGKNNLVKKIIIE